MTEWLVLAIAMALACAVVLTVTVLRHRRVPEDDDPSQTPDVIEYMVMMVGVVYAIVLGLAIAGVWEARGAAEDGTRQEAQALHEISSRAKIYPAATEDRIQEDVRRYTRHVTAVEWPRMIEQHELTDRGTELLDTLRQDIAEREPANDLEAQTYQPLLDQVAAADEARRARADNAEATLPGVVWFGLVAGAIVTVGLIFTLQIRRSSRELLLAGTFSALIAFLLFLVWNFDAPFGRSVTESTSAFQDLLTV
ncbi:bestrophin-like domain [Streptomyces formicae]